ncbi:MAG: hypothetical protein C5B54_07980 [Acidobacteria bacterium]|nr:MAG: hypothetical protein C5B54_07980 [Acidobacteriota bacterium]
MSANDKKIPHYNTEYQHWDLAVAIPMSYLVGCSTKYVVRWRKKGGIDDLHKAMHYLDKLMDTYLPVPIPRTMSRSEIQYEISRFAALNHLSIIEEEFIFKLCSYKSEDDLMEARLVLEDIIDLAEHSRTVYPEPNYPGTPDDGGHHAKDD